MLNMLYQLIDPFNVCKLSIIVKSIILVHASVPISTCIFYIYQDESNIVTPPKKKSTANGKQSQISNGSSPSQTSKKRHKSQKGKKSAGDVIRDSNGVTLANNTEEKEEQSQIKVCSF